MENNLVKSTNTNLKQETSLLTSLLSYSNKVFTEYPVTDDIWLLSHSQVNLFFFPFFVNLEIRAMQLLANRNFKQNCAYCYILSKPLLEISGTSKGRIEGHSHFLYATASVFFFLIYYMWSLPQFLI